MDKAKNSDIIILCKGGKRHAQPERMIPRKVIMRSNCRTRAKLRANVRVTKLRSVKH